MGSKDYSSTITLYQGDCLEKMKKIPDKSVDLVLCDLPYGTTACKWDCCIDLEKLWKEYKRILKDKGNILLFGDGGLFTASLMMSNKKWFKYNWIWKKNNSTGFLNAKKQPLRQLEIISVFGRPGQNNYYPQMEKEENNHIVTPRSSKCKIYGKADIKKDEYIYSNEYYPTNIIDKPEFNLWRNNRLHSSQKPVPLLEYLIKTYTQEGDTVLDNCMGSGSTGIAAKNLNRDFIGIELDKDYFEVAKNRIESYRED